VSPYSCTNRAGTCDALLKYGPQSAKDVSDPDWWTFNELTDVLLPSLSRRAVLVAQAKRFVLMQEREWPSLLFFVDGWPRREDGELN